MSEPATDIRSRAQYKVRAKVWLYSGKGGWHFANLSPKQSAEIKARFAGRRLGWGSVPIRVRIGKTEWDTSLFPQKRANTYLFAIKATVRNAENISAGDTITALVTIK